MAVTSYWVGSTFVAEWTLTETGATVTGLVRQPPSNPDAAMGVDSTDDPTHKLSFQPAVPGRHVAALDSDDPDGHEEVEFFVKRSLLGLAPIVVDTTTDVGKVRLLCTDTDEELPHFLDSEIQAFLTLEVGLKRAAALALETLAAREVLTSRKFTTQDLATDGPAVAKELRERAAVLRKRAQEEDDQSDSDDFGLLVVPLASFPPAPYWGDWNL